MKRLLAALAVAAVASGGLVAAPAAATATPSPVHIATKFADTQMGGASGGRVKKPVGRFSVRPRRGYNGGSGRF